MDSVSHVHLLHLIGIDLRGADNWPLRKAGGRGETALPLHVAGSLWRGVRLGQRLLCGLLGWERRWRGSIRRNGLSRGPLERLWGIASRRILRTRWVLRLSAW